MYKNKTFCFSPPVMLATLFIEFFGIIYTIVRYKMDRVAQLVVAILLCLGVFQLAEYLICEVTDLPGLTWARIGYVSITLLPPLGISLAMALAGKKSWKIQTAIYTACAAFVVYFLGIDNSITAQVCAGNYVIFTTHPDAVKVHSVYYFGLLAYSVGMCFYWRSRIENSRTKKALLALAVGYLSFIVPAASVHLINPATLEAIPSIMCGFAVMLAIILLAWVLPNGGTLRKSAQ